MTLHRPGPRCYCQNNETGNVLFNFILCIVHSGATLHLRRRRIETRSSRRDVKYWVCFSKMIQFFCLCSSKRVTMKNRCKKGVKVDKTEGFSLISKSKAQDVSQRQCQAALIRERIKIQCTRSPWFEKKEKTLGLIAFLHACPTS